MLCSLKPRNNQTRKANKVKLIFTRIGTRKNNNEYKNKTNHIQKHRALNNLVKYLKHIEKDDKIMKDSKSKYYLNQDKIHISELQDKLKEVNKSLNNANKKVLRIHEDVANELEDLNSSRKQLNNSIHHKI